MDPKAARLAQIGVLLYGEVGWQARLARALGISVSYMSSLATGSRRITPEFEAMLADKIAGEITTELHERIGGLNDLVAKIRIDLDQEASAPSGPSA